MNREKQGVHSISFIRNQKSYSIEEVSANTGIDVNALISYESHPETIPLNTAVKLLEFYKVNFKNVRFRKCDI